MARKQLTYSVSGSTLVEVLISMVVIVTVFGIAMMIFTNVMRYTVSEQRLRAMAVLKDELLKTETQRRFSDQTFSDDNFSIKQTITPFGNNGNLFSIKLTAFDKNQTEIATLQKIVIANQ